MSSINIFIVNLGLKVEMYPHKYETILSKDIWGMYEDVRNGRGLHKHKCKMATKHGIYRGLIVCKECGCSIAPEKHTKT